MSLKPYIVLFLLHACIGISIPNVSVSAETVHKSNDLCTDYTPSPLYTCSVCPGDESNWNCKITLVVRELFIYLLSLFVPLKSITIYDSSFIFVAPDYLLILATTENLSQE